MTDALDAAKRLLEVEGKVILGWEEYRRLARLVARYVIALHERPVPEVAREIEKRHKYETENAWARWAHQDRATLLALCKDQAATIARLEQDVVELKANIVETSMAAAESERLANVSKALFDSAQEAAEKAEAELAQMKGNIPMFVYRCSNPKCTAVFDYNPCGHCSVCVAENGSGWSTIRTELRTKAASPAQGEVPRAQATVMAEELAECIMAKASPEHEIIYQELVALVSRHAEKISAAEILAIAANMVGKLIAMQDQRTMTREKALEIVAQNIEAGNAQIVGPLKIGGGLRQ